MKSRPYWINRILAGWENKSIVWLSGVRRAGKTTLSGMISDAVYMNCDLPSVHRELADPEMFFRSLDKGTTVIFDEVHRLDDPTQLLKIAADEYPELKVLATGSSTLAATKKFRDSLTGRKSLVFLPPVLWEECSGSFEIKNLDHRLLHGGLPESLLSKEKDYSFFAEWLDSFYARDIQELFGIRKRDAFLKLLQLLLRQSAAQLDYSKLAKLTELSRPSARVHIEAMRIAHALFLLPPFHGGSRREIVRMPKCYTFDTGFVTYAKGWETIRDTDRGLLWEHLVLDSLRSRFNENNLYYWKDKSQREIDFVIKKKEQIVDTVECKINPDNFEPDHFSVFRSFYPNGANYVISPAVQKSYQQRIKGLTIRFCSDCACMENFLKRQA